ncbi:hypothetical protein OA095_03945 [Candidatus Pelagibacter sp.]|nr:hypothetical protein [Candidatus Pelagibacter sp.]
MSSEIHKYIETAIDSKKNLLNAEIIDFPNDYEKNNKRNLVLNSNKFWKITDKSNNDQLKAVTGICFVLAILTMAGLYSNFL